MDCLVVSQSFIHGFGRLSGHHRYGYLFSGTPFTIGDNGHFNESQLDRRVSSSASDSLPSVTPTLVCAWLLAHDSRHVYKSLSGSTPFGIPWTHSTRFGMMSMQRGLSLLGARATRFGMMNMYLFPILLGIQIGMIAGCKNPNDLNNYSKLSRLSAWFFVSRDIGRVSLAFTSLDRLTVIETSL